MSRNMAQVGLNLFGKQISNLPSSDNAWDDVFIKGILSRIYVISEFLFFSSLAQEIRRRIYMRSDEYSSSPSFCAADKTLQLSIRNVS